MSEPEQKFDPRSHLIDLKGKKYLPVAARIASFRAECPIFDGWGIRTQQVAGSLSEKFATFRAEVTHPEGAVVAVGTKTEDIGGFGDFMEKAETGAIGRALATAGFGTLFALEFDEGEVRITDAPIAPKKSATSAVCTICNDAAKPVLPPRVTFCNQKKEAITHLDCLKGQG